MVMQPAEDGMRFDASGALHRARDRRIFVERSMGPQFVVVGSIFLQNSAQVRLTQNDDVVDAHAGSIPSAVRQSHSAKGKLVQWAYPQSLDYHVSSPGWESNKAIPTGEVR
jgi:hypothetical protein